MRSSTWGVMHCMCIVYCMCMMCISLPYPSIPGHVVVWVCSLGGLSDPHHLADLAVP
jgi:hypothetical protein